MPFLPRRAATVCLRRASKFLDLAEYELPDNRIKSDLRRMALVLAVSAVDCYMHGIVIRRIGPVRREGDLPKILANLNVPFSELGSLADAWITVQRKGDRARPWVRVKDSLQKKLLTMTFQSSEEVGRAFAMAGVKAPWQSVADRMGVEAEDAKRRLDALVKRRNLIVHEGDMQRASRPRKPKFNKVRQSEVRNDIEWVRRLIAAMDNVVTS